jgi:hypothetical protein
MHLAHITSAADNQAVASSFASVGTVWIGINDIAVSDSWTFAQFNTPIVFTKWAPGEPNGGTSENCVHMYPDGNWNDLPCDRTVAFVCSGACAGCVHIVRSVHGVTLGLLELLFLCFCFEQVMFSGAAAVV